LSVGYRAGSGIISVRIADSRAVILNATQELLRFGIFELNLDTAELRKSGMLIKLPPQPLQLLVMLASHAGQIVTRDAIQMELWKVDSEVDFEHGMRQCIAQIRTVLGDNADSPRYVETIPRQGYRFVAPVMSKTVAPPLPQVEESSPSGMESAIASRVLAKIAASATATAASKRPPVRESSRRATQVGLAAAFVVLIALVAGRLFWRAHTAPALTDKDTIVLAEFDNRTGDPVFDGTLRQGLSAQLEQSPFLNLLSDQHITQTLSLMARPKDTRLTGEVAREVSERTASAATIEGSIAILGTQYVLGLRAVNCRNGDLLAEEVVTADNKEKVLTALSDAASRMRRKLGESLVSVQKYDVRPENVTTASLEALRAYSLGYQAMIQRGDYPAAIPLFQRAISLDPNFAMAYARLGTSYQNLAQTVRATENMRKAYELRERVSEREKLYIASHYELFVTGNLEAARKIYELWALTYPRDYNPASNLTNIYTSLGNYDKATAAAQETVRLNPESGLAYSNLLYNYLAVGRLDDAKATAQEAQAHNFDNPAIHGNLYLMDFLQHDQTGMQHETAALMGKPGQEDVALYLESDTAAYSGEFAKARKLTQRAAGFAQQADAKETAAAYQARAAVREALVGNMGVAKQPARAALALSNGKEAQAIAALALALAGDSAQATRLAGDLARRFPEDTIVQFNYLPAIRAAAAQGSGSPAKALEALVPAAPYELSLTIGSADFALCPVYLRGEAFLAAHQGSAAAAEFQKILDHPGVVQNEVIGALAHLGLGRAYALSGDTGKAKAAYQDFLTLWKDADPDIPILIQAKAEYAKL